MLFATQATELIWPLDKSLHDQVTRNERDQVLSVFYRLAKSARVYPRCYELRGIQYDPKPVAEGGFATVHKGTHKSQTICLKIMKPAKDETLRRVGADPLLIFNATNYPDCLTPRCMSRNSCCGLTLRIRMFCLSMGYTLWETLQRPVLFLLG